MDYLGKEQPRRPWPVSRWVIGRPGIKRAAAGDAEASRSKVRRWAVSCVCDAA